MEVGFYRGSSKHLASFMRGISSPSISFLRIANPTWECWAGSQRSSSGHLGVSFSSDRLVCWCTCAVLPDVVFFGQTLSHALSPTVSGAHILFITGGPYIRQSFLCCTLRVCCFLLHAFRSQQVAVMSKVSLLCAWI